MIDFSQVAGGFLALLDPIVFAYMIGGFLIGLVFAAIPGLTGTLALALLLPITFGMDVTPSLVMCAALFMAGQYGGSITAIAINIPGAPCSVMTGLEGNKLMIRGEGARAMRQSAIASAIGGVVGAVLLILLAPFVARAALWIQTPGKFSLIMFALVIVIISNKTAISKGIIATVLGVMIATIGVDVLNPVARQTFGISQLIEGVDLMALIIGTFALAEVFTQLVRRGAFAKDKIDIRQKMRRLDFVPRLSDVREIGLWTYIKSSLIGYGVGVLPGAGGSAASFVSYAEAKRASKRPEEYGNGSGEGVAAAEAANNSMCSGSLVPMLTFGIPGDTTAAIILGVLVINGLQPGPQLFTEQFHLVAPMMAALLVCALLIPIALVALGPIIMRVVQINKAILFPAIAVMALIGVYASTYSAFQMLLAAIIGLLAYLMNRQGYPTVSLLLGFILGPDLEVYLRRSLSITDGNPAIFLTSGDSLFFLGLTAIFFYFMVLRRSPTLT
ncbi:tripartite tricarboxylate transporter permease [Pelagibacterium sp.]|uniref:tripartite tricarboxylate transporter permease n=1 Tax=Pelagibacterium sp. TaxID=1967288 RepID=UPI003C7D8A9C